MTFNVFYFNLNVFYIYGFPPARLYMGPGFYSRDPASIVCSVGRGRGRVGDINYLHYREHTGQQTACVNFLTL